MTRGTGSSSRGINPLPWSLGHMRRDRRAGGPSSEAWKGRCAMTTTTTTRGTARSTTRGATREIEGRDSVGLYLDEIARNPLLDAAREVELSKTIEGGLKAEHLLREGRVGRRKGGAPMQATQDELEWLAEEGRKAVDTFITANL